MLCPIIKNLAVKNYCKYNICRYDVKSYFCDDCRNYLYLDKNNCIKI